MTRYSRFLIWLAFDHFYLFCSLALVWMLGYIFSYGALKDSPYFHHVFVLSTSVVVLSPLLTCRVGMYFLKKMVKEKRPEGVDVVIMPGAMKFNKETFHVSEDLRSLMVELNIKEDYVSLIKSVAMRTSSIIVT